MGAEARLRVADSAPPTELASGFERAGWAGGRLEDCVHELATRRSRVARLHAAQRAEVAGSLLDARRQYTALAGFADTGPAALLGLARLDDGRARDALGELERRVCDPTAP